MALLRIDVATLGAIALLTVGLAIANAPQSSPLYGFERSVYIVAVGWTFLALLRAAFSRIGSRGPIRAPASSATGRSDQDAQAAASYKGSEPLPATQAEVRIRVHRAMQETGNAAGETWRRWLHLVVENMSKTEAKQATVRIRFRPGDLDRDWFWAGGRQVVELKRGLPIAVPVLIGDVMRTENDHLPIGKWYLTPQGHQLDKRIEIATYRYWLDVRVDWSGGSVEDWFILNLSDRVGAEPELIHTVSNDRY